MPVSIASLDASENVKFYDGDNPPNPMANLGFGSSPLFKPFSLFNW